MVAAWLAGSVVNLWAKPEYRDIARRDVGLALGLLRWRARQRTPGQRRMMELPA